MTNKVGKLCLCGKIYYTGKPRCVDCERKRSQDRPWYKMPVYREAQVRSRSMVGRPCPRCGTKMTGQKHRPSVDHINPIASGGSWYGPFEVVCLACNLLKGSSKRAKDGRF